jgi:hypothetical protein
MRFRIPRSLMASALVVGFLAACGSSSTSTGNSACQNYAKAFVSYQARCSGTVDPTRTNSVVGRYGQLCQAELSQPGVASSTSDALNACATAIQGADCNISFEQLDACVISIAGTLANGATCTDPAQCSSGSCSASTTTTNGGGVSCGTCQPAIADGAPCADGGACVSGDTCTVSTSGDGGTGSPICTARPALGDIGAACTANTECKAPNHCAVTFTNGNESGTCAAPIAAGGTCTEKTDCTSGLICTGAASRTCTTPLSVGASCNGGDCGVGFACDATFKCIAITFVAPGGTCDGDERFCSQGSCPIADDGTNADPTGTCPTIIADGQPCDAASTTTAQCDTFAICTNGKCALGPATCN